MLRQLHKNDFSAILRTRRTDVLRMKQMLAKYGSLGTSRPTLWSRLLLPVGELRDIRFIITLQTFHVMYFHEHRRTGFVWEGRGAVSDSE